MNLSAAPQTSNYEQDTVEQPPLVAEIGSYRFLQTLRQLVEPGPSDESPPGTQSYSRRADRLNLGALD